MKKLDCDDAKVPANLHIKAIDRGFISSLGERFATALYSTICSHDQSFCIGAEDNGRIVGFVTFTENLTSLYKAAFKKHCFAFIRAIGPKLLSATTIKRVVQNLLYPAKTERLDLPPAELLSIVVEPASRGKEIAKQLCQLGLQECRKRRIDKVKVLVAEDNESANRLYQKCDFELVAKVNSHGVPSNIYVIDLGKVDEV